MDHTRAPAGANIELIDLNDWLAHQLDQWRSWAAGRDESWLGFETNNPQFPTAADLLMHAFGPLHRYADRILGAEPTPSPKADGELTWDFISDWASRCLARHREAIDQLDPDDPSRLVQFDTQSMGRVQARSTRVLAHAAMHAAWHLGGLIHLLRKTGLEPPQRSDFLYWGISQEEPAGG